MIADIGFLGSAKIIPVLAVADLDDAEPLGSALLAGGIKYLEVTLRTSVAYDVISRLQERVPGAVVGVGSVRSAQELQQAVDAGAEFAVSPGCDNALMQAAIDSPIPFVPGAATPSEVMTLLAAGFRFQKFFPAEINGGVKALKAYSGPLGQVKFCPTGGVSLANAKDYLALSNVVCVGGSWMVPSQAIQDKDWGQIQSLAQQATQTLAG